jgi:hypothetical protein
MVVWGFEIGDRHLRFRRFCIKIIIKGIQKSEITDCDTGGCGMWVINDQQVAEGQIEKTLPYRLALNETFDVGRDTGTPIVETYQVPFAFTGNLQKVTLNLK